MSDQTLPPRRMIVEKYIPQGFYGFVSDAQGSQVFFHMDVFICGERDLDNVPPITGESVEVFVNLQNHEGKQSPRAERVKRINPPCLLTGVVETFDTQRGFGFILGSDGVSYHLHRSELVRDKLPYNGRKVRFYAGKRKNRPRACHVEVL